MVFVLWPELRTVGIEAAGSMNLLAGQMRKLIAGIAALIAAIHNERRVLCFYIITMALLFARAAYLNSKS